MDGDGQQPVSNQKHARIRPRKLSTNEIRRLVVILTLALLLIHFFVIPLIFTIPDWVIGIKYEKQLSGASHPPSVYEHYIFPNSNPLDSSSESDIGWMGVVDDRVQLGMQMRESWLVYILSILLLVAPAATFLWTKKRITMWLSYLMDGCFIAVWTTYAVQLYIISWGV
jgi:hypothetical protein